MADEVARLVAVMEAQLKGFTKGMDQAKALADRRFGQIEARMSQTERRFSSFGRNLVPGIDSLIGRYLRLGLIIATLRRAMIEQAETNTEAAKAMAELNRAWEAWGQIAATVLSPVLSLTGKILQNLAGITKELLNANASGAWQKFAEATSVNPANMNELQRRSFERMGLLKPGEQIRTSGIPFASAGNIPESVQVTPSKLPPRAATGTAEAPVSLTEAISLAEAVKDLGQAFMDTLHAEQEFRSEQYLIAQTLRNDSARAVEEAREELAELAAEAQQLEQEHVADRIAAIGDGFEYLGRAALEGADAFKRALQDMVASLAASGLRNLLEAGLNSIAGGGGFFGGLISGRASGGPVTRGTPYVVGEKGPELFVPGQSGTIVPTPASPVAGYGGGTIELHQHMSLSANGDAQVAAIAQRAAAEGAAVVIKTVQRNFPNWMVKAQRNNL